MMRKIIFVVLLLVGMGDALAAYNPPRDYADVTARNISSLDRLPKWLALGHVGMYDRGYRKMLEVTSWHPAIDLNDVKKTTGARHYWGARYGRTSSSQRYRIIRAGRIQKDHYSSYYSLSPYFKEGKWTYKWRWSWRRGFYKKWYKRSAHFRCDSFVNYCYKKGTGKLLVKWKWTTTPRRIHRALPYRR